MKKIAMVLATLFALGMLFVNTGCKDGDDGQSATDLVLSETGNVWYKYADASGSTPTSSGTSLGTVYIKYDTSSDKLVVAAVGDTLCGETSKELSRGKWAASVVALRVAGKIQTQTSDPTSGKTKVTDIDWKDFTAESLITKLFS